MAKITILNGPNLNLLGIREPGHYGNKTLADIQKSAAAFASKAGHTLSFHQNNAEHELVELIHQAFADQVDFIIINQFFDLFSLFDRFLDIKLHLPIGYDDLLPILHIK